MTQEHPITPPSELVQQWWHEAALGKYNGADADKHVTSMAAQWGADQELEACCEWLEQQTLCGHQDLLPSFCAARRPKPPSLKEQALAELAEWENVMDIAPDSPIRRALEQLDD